MNSQIELQYLVDYCKQLPTYKDALPITQCITEWGMNNDAVSGARLAVEDIRQYFRLMAQTPETNEPKKLPPTIIETPEIPELKFFVDVDAEDAAEFKEVLRNCIAKINTNGKKEWFCIYAAWRYYKKERETDGGYVDFFTDIDTLFPGLLKDVRKDLEGNRRLKPYCDMLRYEYNNWAVADGKLPPMQVWAHEEWTRQYKNTWKTIQHMQALVRDFYKAFAALLGNK
jgi:hypothetical protein